MSHIDDHFDRFIDRAARQLVDHDPPQRLHAAVMSEVRGLGQRKRASWVQWPLLASAAAAVIVALVVWNQLRQVVEHDAPTQMGVVTEVPAPTASPEQSPVARPASLRRERRPAATTVSVPSVAEPEPLIPAIQVRQIRIDAVRVATIEADPLAIPVIQISTIDIDSR